MKITVIDKKVIYAHELALKVERAARNQRKKDAESFEKLKASGDYVPRVVEVSYIQIKEDRREVERIKTFNNFPIHPMEDSILTAMQRKAYQTNKLVPNPNYISSRKNPRLVNNSSKYTTRHRNNRFIKVQHRPIPIKALNKRALDFIKEGNNPKLMFNSLGRIDNIYRKTVLKYPKQSHERTYGLK